MGAWPDFRLRREARPHGPGQGQFGRGEARKGRGLKKGWVVGVVYREAGLGRHGSLLVDVRREIQVLGAWLCPERRAWQDQVIQS